MESINKLGNGIVAAVRYFDAATAFQNNCMYWHNL